MNDSAGNCVLAESGKPVILNQTRPAEGNALKILILGGGASGMMAALTAAELSGAHVTLLERQARVGKKLLATGNGRCNLTNVRLIPDAPCLQSSYNGCDPAFLLPALTRFDVSRTRIFFRALGLLTVQEPSGRVYPLSDQANSVVDVLRFALDQAGVETVFGFDAVSVRKKARGYELCSAEGTARFGDKLIVAAGGCAGKTLGGTDAGCRLLAQLGHTCTELRPSLTPLRTDPAWIRGLKGVRADAFVRLRKGGRTLCASSGELQFTDYGVSGPVIFDLSRAASAGSELVIDLLRDYAESDVRAMLAQRVQRLPSLPAQELLSGMLHPRLGRMLVRGVIREERPLHMLTDAELDAVCAQIKSLTLPVTGALGFESAQVTAGGIRTSEFDPQTLESRLAPGVFACGEVLDVDGVCGGYNLQWAWSSGRLAGLVGTGRERL